MNIHRIALTLVAMASASALARGQAAPACLNTQPCENVIAAPGEAAKVALQIPTETGMYVARSDGHLQRVEGRVTSFERTGSRLASAVTAGIHSAKTNAQIPGEHSHAEVTPESIFYYRVAPGNEAAGGSVGDLVLTRMTVKSGRRQFEISAQGLGRASKGISLRHQVEFDASEIEPGFYKIVPSGLSSGEYGFYLFRGQEMHGFVYDFSVQ